jgi:hypothetical protein
MIQAAIQRESSDEDSALPDVEHHHRIPLGLILLSHGWITHLQLQHALERQRRAERGRIGQWLIEECGLDPARVTRGLSVQWGCPVLSLDGFDPAAMALAVPKLLVERIGILPVRAAGRRTLYLAFADQPDASAAFAMERMSGLKVESGLVDPAEWRAAHESLCKCDFVAAQFESVANVEALAATMASAISRLQPRASRLVRVHQFYWLRLWLESGAMTAHSGGIPSTREDVADHLYCVGAEQ